MVRRVLAWTCAGLAGLAGCALAAGFFHVAYYHGGRAGPQVTVVLRGGLLEVWNSGSYYPTGLSANGVEWRAPAAWPVDPGLVTRWGIPSGVFDMWMVRVPLLPLVIGFSGAAWWMFARGRGGAGRDPGRCACGYDLSGLVEGRCPECGAPNVTLAGRAGRAASDGP